MTENNKKDLETFFVKSESFSGFEGNNRNVQSIEDRDIKKGNVEC